MGAVKHDTGSTWGYTMPYSFSMSNTASNVLISPCINKWNQPNNPLIFHNSCHKATADTLVTKAHFSCHDTPVERWLLVSIWAQLFPTVSQYILIFSFTIAIRYIYQISHVLLRQLLIFKPPKVHPNNVLDVLLSEFLDKLREINY